MATVDSIWGWALSVGVGDFWVQAGRGPTWQAVVTEPRAPKDKLFRAVHCIACGVSSRLEQQQCLLLTRQAMIRCAIMAAI